MASIYTRLLRKDGFSENWLRSLGIAPKAVKRAIWKVHKHECGRADYNQYIRRCRVCGNLYYERWVVSQACDSEGVDALHRPRTKKAEQFEDDDCCCQTCWRESPEYKEKLRDWQKQGEIIRQRIEEAAHVRAASEDFYASREWLEIRYQALLKHGGKCLACGRGAWSGVTIQVDHIEPRSLFPELALDLNNLQVLCHECNSGKSNKHAGDWRR